MIDWVDPGTKVLLATALVIPTVGGGLMAISLVGPAVGLSVMALAILPLLYLSWWAGRGVGLLLKRTYQSLSTRRPEVATDE